MTGTWSPSLHALCVGYIIGAITMFTLDMVTRRIKTHTVSQVEVKIEIVLNQIMNKLECS